MLSGTLLDALEVSLELKRRAQDIVCRLLVEMLSQFNPCLFLGLKNTLYDL